MSRGRRRAGPWSLAIALCGLAGCGDAPTTPAGPSAFGFSWLRDPTPTLQEVCVLADGAVVAVGAEGTVLCDDGDGWRSLDLPVRWWMFDVHGRARDDFWVVGDEGRIFHHGAGGWTPHYSGLDGSLLTGVWSAPTGEAYAVSGSGAILRYDGTSWVRQEVGDVGEPLLLRAVWGSARDDVYTVGAHGCILHWDGESWEQEDGGTWTHLNGIWGDGGGRVWAVGHGDETGAILRRQDGIWTVEREEQGLFLESISGGPDGRPLAVGRAGRALRLETGGWRDLPATSRLDLLGAAVTADGWGLAVGRDGLVLAETREGWQEQRGGEVTAIRRLGCTDTGDVFALGSRYRYTDYGGVWGPYGTGVTGHTLLRHDGRRWAAVAAELPFGLLDLWVSPEGVIHVSGREGRVLRWDGSSLEEIRGVGGEDLHGLGGLAVDDLFAVGDGTVLRWDGVGWTEVAVPATAAWRRVHACADGTVLVLGEDDVLLTRLGGIWKAEELPGALDATDVWASGRDDVFVVGENDRIAHWNGSVWEIQASPSTYILFAIWGEAPDRVYACGNWGTLVHHDGQTWRTIDTGMRLRLYDLCGRPDGSLITGGLWGGVLRYGP